MKDHEVRKYGLPAKDKRHTVAQQSVTDQNPARRRPRCMMMGCSAEGRAIDASGLRVMSIWPDQLLVQLPKTASVIQTYLL
jgi:hypothetical protein